MKLIKDPDSIKELCLSERAKGKSIGFVPTMGALHLGHLSLVRNARNKNDLVVASVFVNPLQFNQEEDFENYPKTLDLDIEKLTAEGCDLIFVPSVEDFYHEKPITSFSFGNLDQVMEGTNRPGHFNGVATVVSKLFHTVCPTRAYFGLKDLQQYLLIKMLERDLNFGIEIVGIPTVREDSGLALSSRNLRLSPEGKQRALILSKSLKGVVENLSKGESIDSALNISRDEIVQEGVELEYLEIGNIIDLGPVDKIQADEVYAVCGAVWVDGVRLIDNYLFNSDFENVKHL